MSADTTPLVKLVKELRVRTGAGLVDCRNALVASDLDPVKAVDWLRAKGIVRAEQKATRVASEGAVYAYIHAGGKVGVLLEMNCETDFVAMTPEFQHLCKEVAMHIAACAPEYVAQEDVPADAIVREHAVQMHRAFDEYEDKPQALIEKIVEGRMSKFFDEKVLLRQRFVLDDTKTVDDVLIERLARIGEAIRVRRFSRFVLGDGLEKRSSDFAAEVAAQAGTPAGAGVDMGTSTSSGE